MRYLEWLCLFVRPLIRSACHRFDFRAFTFSLKTVAGTDSTFGRGHHFMPPMDPWSGSVECLITMIKMTYTCKFTPIHLLRKCLISLFQADIKGNTVKCFCNDHLYDKTYYLWFIQYCVLMKTECTYLLLLTISAFWSSLGGPWPPRWAPEGREVSQ